MAEAAASAAAVDATNARFSEALSELGGSLNVSGGSPELDGTAAAMFVAQRFGLTDRSESRDRAAPLRRRYRL